MLSDIITSGAMHSLKCVFQKKKERNVIIDPFSCLVKLSLIKYLQNCFPIHPLLPKNNIFIIIL